MPKIDLAFFDISYLDTLAGGNTSIHSLDPRAKLITTLFFVVTVASFEKYEISALLPLFLFPASLVALARLPAGYLAKKLILVAPFAIFIGVFNPVFDRDVLLQVGPLGISAGWVSFTSIMLRFVLSISAALILVATTSFPGVCMALEKLGTPRVFAVQLLFLYRYLFVLGEEGQRLIHARALRSFHGRGMGIKILGNLLGTLLLRTLARAQRIHQAMLSRGFTGRIIISRTAKFGWAEVWFVLGWCCVFVIMRLYNLPQISAQLLTELFR